MDDNIKWWIAKRKIALVIEIIRGGIRVFEASQSFDLTPSEIDACLEGAEKEMENPLRANPLAIHVRYENGRIPKLFYITDVSLRCG